MIETNRLELHLISVEDLLLLEKDPSGDRILENQLFENPYKVLHSQPSPVRYRAPQVKINPELNIWFIRWIVEKSSRTIVGSISFHGPPDDRGMIEVGLGIADERKNEGFAKEALLEFWSWAKSQPGVKVFRYTVSPDNLASISVIKFFEFEHVGIQIDDEDGPEEIFELSCETFASNENYYRTKLGL